jgi:hypothetical protein
MKLQINTYYSALVLALLMIAVAFGVPHPAHAQVSAAEIASSSSPMNVTLTPVSLFINSDPGASTTSKVRVRNNSDKAESLQIRFGTFRPDETGDHPKLITPDPNDQSMQWMSASPSAFIVQPGDWQDIDITFNPPADAGLSYYYSILFQRSSSKMRPGEAVIQGSPAVLSVANVNSPYAVRQLDLLSFKAKHAVVEYLPQRFDIQMRNSGNVHLIPAGNIFIDGQGQTDIAVMSVNPKLLTVLPESSRTLDVTWTDGFPITDSVDTQKLPGLHFLSSFWDFSKADRFRIGKYTAHLLLVYDNGERDIPIESFVTFWVIPWKIILAGLVIGLLALAGLRSLLLFFIHLLHLERPSPKHPSSSP